METTIQVYESPGLPGLDQAIKWLQAHHYTVGQSYQAFTHNYIVIGPGLHREGLSTYDVITLTDELKNEQR